VTQWTGLGDGTNWDDPDNWTVPIAGETPPPPPGAGDIVDFANVAGEPLTSDPTITGTGAAQTLDLFSGELKGNASGIFPTVTFDGATINVAGGDVEIQAGSALVLTGGTEFTFIESPGSFFGFFLGNENPTGAIGTVTVSGAGTSLNIQGPFSGAPNSLVSVLAGGSLQITDSTNFANTFGSLTVSGSNLSILQGAADVDGTFEVDGGATVATQQLFANCTVTGAGTTLTATALTDGDGVISDDAVVTVSGALEIGGTITDGGSLKATGGEGIMALLENLTVSDATVTSTDGGGTALDDTVQIDDGATVTVTGALELGETDFANSNVTVDGAGTTVTPDSIEATSLVDTLTVSDGAQVTDNGIFNLNAGTSTLTVTDAGSELSVAGTFSDVDGGTSTILIEDGAQMSVSGDFDIAQTVMASVTVTGSGTSLSVAQTLNLDEAGGDSTLKIADGAAVTITGDFDLGPLNALASATVTDSGTSLTVKGTLNIGGMAAVQNASTILQLGSQDILTGGTATFTIAAGAQVTAQGDVDLGLVNSTSTPAQPTGTNSLMVTDTDTQLSMAGTLNVDGSGAGSVTTVTIENGSAVTVDKDLDLAPTNGASANVMVTGNGTSLAVTGTINVGGTGASGGSSNPSGGSSNGTATLTIADGASVDPPDLVIAATAAPQEQTPNNDPATGFSLDNIQTVNVTDGGMLDAGMITVGAAGNGELNVNGGSVIAADAITIGDQAGSQGQLIFDGANQPLESADLTVGNAGKGLLTIGNGNAVTTNGDATLGAESGSTGMVTLNDGTGTGNASWLVSGNLTVGGAGIGTLVVNPQASLTLDGTLSVGDQTGGNGLATFSGSTLSMAAAGGTIMVGNSGKGTLIFQEGATLQASAGAPSATLGAMKGSSGTLTVSGKGSTVALAALQVGVAGAGALNVNNGGALQVEGEADIAAGAAAAVQKVTINTGGLMAVNGDLTFGAVGVVSLVLQSAAEIEGDANVTFAEDSTASVIADVIGPVAGSKDDTILAYGQTLTIGDAGVATLSITAGGMVKAASDGTGNIVVAAQSGSEGKVSLSGVGSALDGTSLDLGGTASTAGGIGTISIASGSTLNISGAAHFWKGASLTLTGGRFSAGMLTLDQGASVSGHGTLDAPLADGGLVAASGGLLDITGSVSGSGTLEVAAGSTLELDEGASGAKIAFKGTGTLVLADATDTSSTISGFAAGDTIELDGITATSARDTSGTLDVFDGANLVASFNLNGNYVGAAFDVSKSGDISDIKLDPNQPSGVPAPTPAVLTISDGGGIEGKGGVAVAVPGISISDSSAGATLTVEIISDTGQLAASTNATGGGGSITPAPDATELTIVGSLAQVNADLSTLTYSATAAGPDTLQLVATDDAGNADSSSINVEVPDQAPTFVLPGPQTVTASASTAITGLAVTDALSTNATFTVRLSDTTGDLTADQDGASTVTGTGTTTLVITGNLDDVNADLATLVFAGGAANDTINITATDSFGLVGSAAIAVTVSASHQQFVSSGVTRSGIVVSGTGSVLEVLSGGTASATVVVAGGIQRVDVGGRAVGARVSSGGVDDIFGSDSFATISRGGAVNVSSGGMADHSTVSSGGVEIVSSGGVASGGTVLSGGLLELLSGGTANGVVINAGGALLLGSGAVLQVSAGQTSDGVVVTADGELDVLSGGKAHDIKVSSGGVFDVAGTTTSNVTVLSGGVETISGGGVASGVTGSGTSVAGGELDVQSGGTVAFALASSGGVLNLSAGGKAHDITVSSGGNFDVAGTTTSNIVIASGGVETASSGGVVSAGTRILNGGEEFILSGGNVTGAVISSGGTQIVESGGTASGTIVSSGGTLEALGSAILSGEGIKAGGSLELTSGGFVSGLSVSNGVTLELGNNGSASAAIVSSGGKVKVLSGGTDSGATVSLGGSEIVSAGGTASATVLKGSEIVSSGGTTVGTTVSSGGVEIVSAGGTASNTTVLSGGTLDVLSGGLADPATIHSGGSEVVSAHGTDDGAQILGGRQLDYGLASGATVSTGSQVIEAGGTASDTTVSSGGVVTVLSGGTAVGLTILTGGTVIASGSATIGGATSGLIEASGKGAQVQLDNAIASGGTLSAGSGAVIATTALSVDSIVGATIAGSSLVEVASGSTLTLSGGTVRLGAVVETLSGGTAMVSGSVSNSGTLFASGSGSMVEIASGAVISGGVAEVGNGIVDIEGGSSENVTFQAGGSGGLELSDDAADPTTYTGKVSGFGVSGGISHADHAQYIDLTSVDFTSGAITLSYTSANASNTSGTLMVTSGGTEVADISLVGAYVTGNFHVSSGAGGTVEITDPSVAGQPSGNAPAQITGDTLLDMNTPASTVAGLVAQNGIDHSGIDFGALKTLVSETNSTAGALPLANDTHTAAIALLVNYMASTFVTGGEGHDSTFVTEALKSDQPPLLAHPHA
jgi:autotransporter passenger strand-loop-strand repeat protein/T5SS/PEP-CTERM-associated repeat protein